MLPTFREILVLKSVSKLYLEPKREKVGKKLLIMYVETRKPLKNRYETFFGSE